MSTVVNNKTSQHILRACGFVFSFRSHFHELLEIKFWRQQLPYVSKLVPLHLAVDVRILETKRIDSWELEQPLLLYLQWYFAVSAQLLLRSVLHSKVAFTLDNLFKNFFYIPLCRRQRGHHMHHFTDVVLVLEYSFCICNVVYYVALSTTCKIDGLYSKSCMRSAFRGTAHIVKSVVHRKLLVAICFYIFFKVVWIDVFSM